MIVHVPRDMNRAFLISVPRDLYFTIQPYPPTHFEGSTEKIDAALNHGGMPLMAQTVADLTDLKFNGAVEARFAGFQKAVTALGGVDMCVDQKTVSVHVGHDQNGNYAAPYRNLDADPRARTGRHPTGLLSRLPTWSRGRPWTTYANAYSYRAGTTTGNATSNSSSWPYSNRPPPPAP